MTKKPKVRRAALPEAVSLPSDEPEVRVLAVPTEGAPPLPGDTENESATEKPAVRVLAVPVEGAPPISDDPSKPLAVDAALVAPIASTDDDDSEESSSINMVPYLTSAVTHAALVLILALLTFSTDIPKEVVMLGVVAEENELDDKDDLEDLAVEMPVEFASSNPVPKQTEHDINVNDEADIEPPAFDDSDEFTAPVHLVPNDDDLWSPVPDGFGPGGKSNGGKGGNGDQSGSKSGKGTSGRDGAPTYAVRKGSFAAWTVPKDPRPLTPYKIIIQVTLPKDVKKYSKDDLSGMVTGTDGYAQSVPQPTPKTPTRRELEEMIDSGRVRLGSVNNGDRMARRGKAPAAEREQLKRLLRQGRLRMSKPAGGSFEFRNGRARVSVTVPGAKNRTRDRIEIASEILEEEQVLEIEF